MFGLGAAELLIVAGIAVLVFGVGRLPQVGGALGSTIREFRHSLQGQGPAAAGPAAAPARAAAGTGTTGAAPVVRRELI